MEMPFLPFLPLEIPLSMSWQRPSVFSFVKQETSRGSLAYEAPHSNVLG